MPRKPKPPPDDAEQSKRFIEIAREAGADEASPEFERVVRSIPEEAKHTPFTPSGRRSRRTSPAKAPKRPDQET